MFHIMVTTFWIKSSGSPDKKRRSKSFLGRWICRGESLPYFDRGSVCFFFLSFLWLKLIILLQNICCLLMHYLHATATVLRIFGLSEPVKGHGQVQLHLTRRAGVSLSSLDACMATFPWKLNVPLHVVSVLWSYCEDNISLMHLWCRGVFFVQCITKGTLVPYWPCINAGCKGDTQGPEGRL